jgi:ATP-dependent exoDNAse (exonuclease V) beta subunit
LWREIGKRDEVGLRLLPDESGAARVYFDGASLPPATKESRERERRRELVRLLYVTLTRARRALVLPAGESAGEGSFLHLWGAKLDGLTSLAEAKFLLPDVRPETAVTEARAAASVARINVALPARLLPHQLAKKPDAVRAWRHETADSEPLPAGSDDPIEYGLWWHETMEFLPWTAAESEMETYLDGARARAGGLGFGLRAERELARLQASGLWRELRLPKWRILSELSVVAPVGDAGWVDGVIDLVAQDVAGGEILIIDWKTNRQRTGEPGEALLDRLQEEYHPQLAAYGTCLRHFFAEASIKLGVYSTALGDWRSF